MSENEYGLSDSELFMITSFCKDKEDSPSYTERMCLAFPAYGITPCEGQRCARKAYYSKHKDKIRTIGL